MPASKSAMPSVPSTSAPAWLRRVFRQRGDDDVLDLRLIEHGQRDRASASSANKATHR